MENVLLKNNLRVLRKENEYVKIRNESNLVYAAITAVLAFLAPSLFNISGYLPMYGCIFFCIICFLLSFFMVDGEEKEIKEVPQKALYKFSFSHIVFLAIFIYAVIYPLINEGQAEAQLWLQEELTIYFSKPFVVYYVGIVLCSSRIIRILGNLVFSKIYPKAKEKVGIYLSFLLMMAFIIMLSGDFLSPSLSLKFVLMGFGYIIILGVRDPIKVYIQDLVLRKSPKETHQVVLSYLELPRKVGRIILSFIVSLLLLEFSLVVIIEIFLVFAILCSFLSLLLYSCLCKDERKCAVSVS